jgi:hypothetical protein
MATKKKAKRVLITLTRPKLSFSRAELRKVIKEFAAARKRRKKTAVADGSK